MRSDGTLKVILNCRAADIIDLKVHPSLNKAIVFGTVENESPISYMLRVKLYPYSHILAEIVW